MNRRAHGFTLLELLVSMVATAVMMAGLIQFSLLQSRSHAREEQRVAMDENLRTVAAMVSGAIRNAGYGAPWAQLSTYLNWVTLNGNAVTIDANPKFTSGATNTPLYVTGCFSKPLATLSASYTVPTVYASATLSVTPRTGVTLTNELDTGSKSLIRVGEGDDAGFARVTVVGSSAITITPLNMPRGHVYWGSVSGGANVCRVDVVTYNVDTTTNRLMRDENQGAQAQPVAEGITSMAIAQSSKTYTVTLNAQSELRDPISGSFVTARTLRTTITLEN